MASENKTYIPGVDYSANRNSRDEFDSLYSRSASSVNDKSKTFIPDMYRQMTNELNDETPKTHEDEIKLQDRNIVGVLFSITRCSKGEIFPIYIGRNTIGSSSDCDICLREGTVSPNHAVLLVRETSNVDGSCNMVISLTDYDSEYGSKVGDEQLMYDKVLCKDHDIISIGKSYQFILSVFTPSIYGLKVDENFMNANKNQDCQDSHVEVFQGPSTNASSKEVGVDHSVVIDDFDFYAPTKKTGNDHSTNKTIVL